MSRGNRLLNLLQLLRQYYYPVTGQQLADKLNISLRTLYRDIEELKRLGANIQSSSGLGYLLIPESDLPPMNFTLDELQSLLIGLQLVKKYNDNSLTIAAESALAKIQAVLPQEKVFILHANEVKFVNFQPTTEEIDSGSLRQAIHQQRKIQLSYQDANHQPSSRVVWPIILGYFDSVSMFAAWCELRQDFRNFRLDRCQQMTLLAETYPVARTQLLKQWQILMQAENSSSSVPKSNECCRKTQSSNSQRG